MKETVRFIVLVLLGIHHLVAWVNMAGIEKIKVDENVERKLRVYKDLAWRFLTNWNFFNQTIYIVTALFLYFAPAFIGEKTIQKIKKINWFNFWSVVFPWSVYIPFFFWSVYIYDRDLIFPRYIDYVFPLWLNHAVHTSIILLVISEPLFNSQRPPRFSPALRTLTIYAITYASVLLFTHFNNNVWLYEFLKVLNWTQKIVYLLGTYVILVLVQWIGLSYQNKRYRINNTNTKINTK